MCRQHSDEMKCYDYYVIREHTEQKGTEDGALRSSAVHTGAEDDGKLTRVKCLRDKR